MCTFFWQSLRITLFKRKIAYLLLQMWKKGSEYNYIFHVADLPLILSWHIYKRFRFNGGLLVWGENCKTLCNCYNIMSSDWPRYSSSLERIIDSSLGHVHLALKMMSLFADDMDLIALLCLKKKNQLQKKRFALQNFRLEWEGCSVLDI